MVVLAGIHTKTRISFGHQQLLLKRTTFRLAYAGHLQVIKEENVQLRDLMYTMMMGGSQVLHKLMFWLHLHKYRLLKCLHLPHLSGHFNKSLVDGH